MVKHDAGGKKGKLLCCKRIFNQIKANFAEIQLKKHQNVKKIIFLQKVPGVKGLQKLSHGILSYFGHEETYLEGKLKIVV